MRYRLRQPTANKGGKYNYWEDCLHACRPFDVCVVFSGKLRLEAGPDGLTPDTDDWRTHGRSLRSTVPSSLRCVTARLYPVSGANKTFLRASAVHAAHSGPFQKAGWLGIMRAMDLLSASTTKATPLNAGKWSAPDVVSTLVEIFTFSRAREA